MARRDEPREGPSQRQLRVGEEIRRVLARILERGELHEPALSGVRLTLSEVSVSPDLRNATVWVIPPVDGDIADVLPVLTRLAGRMSGMAAREVRMRFAPRLTFKRDTAFDTASKMDALLNAPAVRRDVQASKAADPDESGTDTGDSGKTVPDGAPDGA